MDPVTVDKLLLVLSDDVSSAINGSALDGEYTSGSGLPSGDGSPGGDFEFRINVLAGDTDGNGTNSLRDLQFLATNWRLQTTDANKFADFDGSHRMTLNDLQILATHWRKSLPAGEPIPLAAAVAAFADDHPVIGSLGSDDLKGRHEGAIVAVTVDHNRLKSEVLYDGPPRPSTANQCRRPRRARAFNIFHMRPLRKPGGFGGLAPQ